MSERDSLRQEYEINDLLADITVDEMMDQLEAELLDSFMNSPQRSPSTIEPIAGSSRGPDVTGLFAQLQSVVADYKQQGLDLSGLEMFDADTNENRHEQDALFANNADDILAGNFIANFVKIGETLLEDNPHDKFRRRWYVTNIKITHGLRSIKDLWANEQELDAFFESMIAPYVDDPEAQRRNDFISVEFTRMNGDFKSFYMAPRSVRKFRSDRVFNKLWKLSQSNAILLMEGEFLLKIRMVKGVIGYGKRKGAPVTVEQNSKQKNTIIQIKAVGEDYGKCGIFALTLGKLYADYNGKGVAKNARIYQPTLRREARKLAAEMSWDYERPIELNDFHTLQTKIDEYQVRLIDEKTGDHFFTGPTKEKQIILLYRCNKNEEHYDLITRLKGYVGKSYYCNFCNVGYAVIGKHKCEHTCVKCCQQPQCKEVANKIECQECFRLFEGPVCFEYHKKYICKRKKYCKKCMFEYTCVRKHECGKKFCKLCGESYTKTPHYCNQKPKNSSKVFDEHNNHKVFVMYDIESNQVQKENKIVHVPDLLVSCYVCDQCYSFETMSKACESCAFCGVNQKIYEGEECVKSFLHDIYNETAKTAEKFRGKVYCFAHNSRGYDGHFVMKDLFTRNFTRDPEIIMTGNKVLMIEIGNVRFIDSLCFFQCSLDSLPKAFGLNAFKGFFPHEILREQYFPYVGKLPPKKYFGPSYMTEKKQGEFNEWYESKEQQLLNENEEYDLIEECKKYCQQDVKILMQAVMKFRKLVKELTNIDPFTNSFTLASLAFEIFESLFLKKDTIGVTPVNEYSHGRKYSKKGLAWILAKEKELKKSHPQYSIVPEQFMGTIDSRDIYADGFCSETNTVYEFDGCHFHACDCDNSRRFSAEQKKEHQLRDQKRESFYASKHYTLVKMRECCVASEPIELLEDYQLFLQHLEYVDEVGPLVIREGFCGGRTQNIFFYYKAENDETLDYYDFKSLYPSVCAKEELPVLHPEILYPLDTDISSYYGFVKCKVLPPKNLHIPVLPVRFEKKLMFPLCYQCMITKEIDDCIHSDAERQILGTWHTRELKLALSKNYKITKIYIVNNYKQTSCNIFESYVKMFMRIKEQASGYPAHITTEEEKDQFIYNYHLNTGIQLTKNEIEHNPGLRTIAKLLLNMIWGKYAQQSNKPKTKICRSFQDYWRILNDSSLKIIGEVDISEDEILVKYKEREITEENASRKINYAIASSVTANARCDLYNEIDKIEMCRNKRVLYFDTDSIIFASKQGEYKPKLGEYLGEMTDEIVTEFGVGARIVEFVSCGPKNYGFHVILPTGESRYVLKCKGIRMSAEAAAIITFKQMVEIATRYRDGDEVQVKVPQFNIYSDFAQNVYTKKFDKIYRAVSDKRRIVEAEMYTRPYGFVE